jgi:sporulation protein YabP
MPAYPANLPEEKRHHILLENRSRLAVSGVEEVARFDENEIVLATCQGDLTIRGSGLHIEQLSLDGGELRVEGTVDALSYEVFQRRTGLFARLMG